MGQRQCEPGVQPHKKFIHGYCVLFYFVRCRGSGSRVAQQAPVAGGNVTVNSFNYYDVHDTDIINSAGLGKLWYGEQFSPLIGNTSQIFTFDMGAPVNCVLCKVVLGSNSGANGCSFTVSLTQ